MIRPQRNAYRDFLSLDGLWRFRADPNDLGRRERWHEGLQTDLRIAVPGSWNEQLAEQGLMTYAGAAWLETEVFVPASFAGRRLALYFGCADFFAEVWADGVLVGQSTSLFLPFEADISRVAQPGSMLRVVVRVENLLTRDSVTQAVTASDYVAEQRVRDELFPAVRFDFYPYGGLSRSVLLSATPRAGLESVQVDTRIDGDAGLAELRAATTVGVDSVRFTLGDVSEVGLADAGPRAMHQAALRLPDARLWSPDDPYLYSLRIEALQQQRVVDQLDLRVGVRELRVVDGQLRLNGRRFFMRGFGKHEDSAIRGRGVDLPLLVKDFELLRWVGANSVRTSHYPYDESFLDLADERGILVISEIPSINLDFRHVTPQTLLNHKRAIAAQMQRDRHHASVVMWSLANEPGYLGEPEYAQRSGEYWKELFAEARRLDPSRLLTFAHVDRTGTGDPAFLECDVICVNRYYGWYDQPGQLAAAAQRLRENLDELWQRYQRPILVSEFGADTVAGMHATHDQLFTEEYQEAFLLTYLDVIDAHPATCGAHVWNFADFRTAQHFRRVIFNLKGIFTRSREPKRAAFALRQRWRRPQ